LPLLVCCIGAVKLKASAVQQLSVCWNNVFRRIFLFKRNEFVRILQVSYDVQRWKFIHTTRNSCAYWSGFIELLDVQFREAAYIVEREGALCTGHSIVGAILSEYVLIVFVVRVYMFVFFFFSFYFFFVMSAFVATKDIYIYIYIY